MADTDIGLDLLGEEERAILGAPYPGFAAAEIAARRERVIAAMAEDNLDALVVAEFGFGGTAVHWLTNWPSTTAAVLVLVVPRMEFMQDAAARREARLAEMVEEQKAVRITAGQQ